MKLTRVATGIVVIISLAACGAPKKSDHNGTTAPFLFVATLVCRNRDCRPKCHPCALPTWHPGTVTCCKTTTQTSDT